MITMTKTTEHNNAEKSVLFITGFLALSTLSTQIMERLHLPYLIELFFVPIILYYYNRNGSRRIKTNTEIKLLFFFFLFFLISSTLIGIVFTGDLYNVITCIRPFIYLSLIAYYCAQKKCVFPLEKVYLVVTGTLFGELTNKLLFMNSIASIDHINSFALAVFVIIPFIIRDWKKIIFSTLFGFIMSVLTLYRREIAIYFIALCSGILFGLFSKLSYNKLIYMIGTGIFGYMIYTNIEKILIYIIDLFNLDRASSKALSASYRIIEKFETSDSASDMVRFNTWSKIFTEFQERLLPRGPVGKAYGLWYFGAYTDSTNIFLYDVFGSVVSWILVAFVLIKALICMYKVIFNKIQNQEIILSALIVPVFLACMATDGTFLVHANISIIAGYAIHGWFVNIKKRKRTDGYI